MVELMGLNRWAFTAFEYGERWRTHRRLFHEFFNIATVDRYDEDQRKAASRLLKNLSDNPTDFRHHVELATGSLALSISYDIQVDSAENRYFSVTEEALDALQAALVPGAFPAEFLHFREFHCCNNCSGMKVNPSLWIVRYFPSWLPGGGARSYGKHVTKCSMDSITLPMQYATERLKVRLVCWCENITLKSDRLVVKMGAPWSQNVWRIWRICENKV